MFLDVIEVRIKEINQEIQDYSPQQVLKWAYQQFNSSITLASSLGPQSIVLTHMMSEIVEQPDVFFLDTGRLHSQTYALLDECMEFFKLKYRVFFPDNREVQEYIENNGPNAFYDSVSMRKECCDIRKVKQLKKALRDYDCWISGVRKEHSSARSSVDKVEWDSRFGMVKLNPLANWTSEMVWDYIKEYDLPYNQLHDEGYASIGCQPCTRPVGSGAPLRSGRWWWESDDQKECGLNVVTTLDNEQLIQLKVNIFDSKPKSGLV